MAVNRSFMPEQIVAGDTWQWSIDGLSDYPASEGWVLSFVLLNASQKIVFDAIAEGDEFKVMRSSEDTSSSEAGVYQWEASVKKGTALRFRLQTGTVEVLPNFGSAETLDTRSHARRVLEAIEAVIERRATKDQEEYSIEGRSLKRTPISDLLTLRDQYRREVDRELARERASKGRATGRRVLVKF